MYCCPLILQFFTWILTMIKEEPMSCRSTNLTLFQLSAECDFALADVYSGSTTIREYLICIIFYWISLIQQRVTNLNVSNMSRTDLSKFGRVGRHISKNDVTAISAWIMILEKMLWNNDALIFLQSLVRLDLEQSWPGWDKGGTTWGVDQLKSYDELQFLSLMDLFPF